MRKGNSNVYKVAAIFLFAMLIPGLSSSATPSACAGVVRDTCGGQGKDLSQQLCATSDKIFYSREGFQCKFNSNTRCAGHQTESKARFWENGEKCTLPKK